jgi:Tfp pilus assembly protein PilN
MASELTNLLPPEKARLFKRTYLFHLGITAIVLCAVLIGTQGILLIPSYLYEAQSVSMASLQLAHISTSVGTSDDQLAQQHMQVFEKEATTLQHFSKLPTASAIIRAILLVPRPGITLRGFVFTPALNGSQPSLQLTGIASTREALRSYDASLAALPYVKSADLPISDYAKESSISFTITLIGPLTP